jgi:hypothetical protein
MPVYHDPDNNSRPFWASLFFTKEGDMDLTWLFVLLMGLAGVFGFVWQLVHAASPTLAIIAGWSFMGAAFASVLIAAIPISKAKILANSKLPGEIAKSISDVAHNVETSTDIQELSEKSNNTTEKG